MAYIIENLPIIIAAIAIVAAVVTFVVWLVKTTPAKRRELINKVLFALAIEAERLYGSKTGQIKKRQVVAWFYERYKWLAMLVSEETLCGWIDEAVTDMNEWLKSNPVGAANIIGTIE